MDTCEMSFIKYILFIFNLFFAISGLAVIIVGAIVLADVTDYNYFLDAKYLAPPIILIVAGTIVFIVAFLGCFGAIKESFNVLMAFAVCLLIIFVLELAVGIAAAVYKNEFDQAFQSTLRQSLQAYYLSPIERLAWDTAHYRMRCCGMYGPSDWNGQRLPQSCCHNDEVWPFQHSEPCRQQTGDYFKNMYEVGCYEIIKLKITRNLKIMTGVGIGIAFVEIIGVICACWLANTIKKESEEEEIVEVDKS